MTSQPPPFGVEARGHRAITRYTALLGRIGRVALDAAGWSLRLSGLVVILAAAVVLVLPSRPTPAHTSETVRTETARPPDQTAGAPTAQPAGTCTDPAIAGCDAFSACAAAVTIGSGLAPDPRAALAEGLRGCTAGAE
jgi:hypothetical protein